MNSKSKTNKLITAIVFALLFSFWAWLVLNGKLTNFDSSIQSFVFKFRCPFLTAIGVSLEYIGHWPLPALVCVVLLIVKDTRFSYGIPMAAGVSVSVGTYEIFKHIFQRNRPDVSLWLCQEHGFSFPSGHTLNNSVFWIAFASLLAYYFLNKGKSLPIYKKDRSTNVYPKSKATLNFLRIILVLWPLIIGVSRIYVGVHWPSDVCGSLMIAVVLLNIAYIILFTKAKDNNSLETATAEKNKGE